jgi:Lon protease-like protein
MPVIKISNESFLAVPVFPLKGVHLFPHTILTLHIFESRYLDMVDYALEHEHLLAIADIDQMETSKSVSRLRSTLGAGVIVDVKSQLDGSKHVLLRGVTRLTLIEERPQIHAFRQVHARILLEEDIPEDPLSMIDYQVRSLLMSMASNFPKMQEKIYAMLENTPSPNILSNMLSAHLVTDRDLQRYLFEEINPQIRLESIFEELADLCVKTSEKNEDIYLH